MNAKTDPARVAAEKIVRIFSVVCNMHVNDILPDIREACAAKDDECIELVAALMMKHSFATGHGDTLASLLGEFDWQIAELRAAMGSIQRSAFDAGFDAGADHELSSGSNYPNPSREQRYKEWANT